MDFLYHYTRTQSCISILKEGSIHMGDIRKSNDSDELLIIYPKIFDIITLQFSKNPFPFKYNHKADHFALQELVDVTRSIIDQNLEYGEFSNFVVCFSENPDLLSQWRAYANDGKGCCIGFSFNELNNHCLNSNNVLQLKKVSYLSQTDLIDLVHASARFILDKLSTLRQDIVDNFTHDDTSSETDNLLGYRFYEMVKLVLTNSLCYKGIGFAEENEWRLFLRTQAYKDPDWVLGDTQKISGPQVFSETLNYLRNKIEFKVFDDNITPYITLPFHEFDNRLINEIRFGPKNNISKSDMELFLAKYEYHNVKLLKSSISYR